MDVRIRKFEKDDIPNKVRWINDLENNLYLHYNLPLEIDKTERWFETIKDRNDRYDAVIEVDRRPVGLIGLLSIDSKNRKAEYYVTIGERDYRGKGVAYRASKLLLDHAFFALRLNRIYLLTERDNAVAVKLYEKLGFRCEGLLKDDLFSKGRFVDRYLYGITQKMYDHCVMTPIYFLAETQENRIYMKREDYFPFSFGGNKARKAQLFFEQIDHGDYDCVVTYGSSSSNHCRVVANMAAAKDMPCFIISPEETSKETYNSNLMQHFGAEISICPVTQVQDTILHKLQVLRDSGHRPYFIAGGGHGNIGTKAYVECYEEIRQFERENHIHFDYIFLASGTGTTQAGLVCGQLINREKRVIVGISIARSNPRGRNVVLQSIREYLEEAGVVLQETEVDQATHFIDEYVGDGYGSHSLDTKRVIDMVMTRYGIPLDSTYTGKAFAGMLDYLKKNGISGQNLLFIHTGGTPLFFDDIRNMENV